jgi:uncharacterized protein
MARKILLFPPVRLIVALLFVVLPAGLAQGIGQLFLGEIAAILGGTVGLLAYIGFVELIERRRAFEAGLKGLPKEIAQGFGLGAGLIVASLGILGLFGLVTIRYTGNWGGAIYWLAAFLGVALFEELIARGIVYRILGEWLGSYAATALSGAFFGVVHLTNPNATWNGALGITLTAGLVLAAAYSITRRIWLAVGLHWGWNFVLGSVFGGVVSGLDTVTGPFKTTIHGPEWLSGGKFGLEASLVPVATCGLLTVWIVAKIRREGKIVPPSWLKEKPVESTEPKDPLPSLPA